MKMTKGKMAKRLAVFLLTAGMAVASAGKVQAYFTTYETARVGTNVQAGEDSEIGSAIIFKLIDTSKTGVADGSFSSSSQPVWLTAKKFNNYYKLIYLNGITRIGSDSAGSKTRRMTYETDEPCLNNYRTIYLPKTVTEIDSFSFYLDVSGSETFTTYVYYGGTQAQWNSMKSDYTKIGSMQNNKILGSVAVTANVSCLSQGDGSYALWSASSNELKLGAYDTKADNTLIALANSSASKVKLQTSTSSGSSWSHSFDMDGDGTDDLEARLSSSGYTYLKMLGTCSLSGKHTYTLDNEALDWALINTKEYYETITIDYGYNLSRLKASDVTIPAVTYTGSAVIPKPVVKFGSEELTAFRVEAKNNINAGKNSATLTILPPLGTNSKGVFGAWSAVFSIKPADISGVNATASNVTWPATQSQLSAVFNGKTLVKGTDYDLSFIGGVAGPAVARMTGKGNYSGTKDVNYSIAPANLSAAAVTAPSVTYNGTEQKPAPTVKMGSTTLGSSDYSVSWSNNKNAGTATVTVTGKGNYTGKKSGTFTIAKASIKGAAVSAPAQTYTGNILLPAPVVKLGAASLVKDADYVASYSNNTNVGKATITITGKGNYSDKDSVSGTFDIVAKSLSGAVVTVSPAAYDYTGAAITPAPVVTLGGKTLKNGTDYTVGYAGNTNAGTAAITVSGKGNYTGTAAGSFTITRKEQPTQSTEPSTEPTSAPAATEAAYTPEAITPQNPAKLANVQNTILNVTDDTKDVKGSTYTLLKAKGVPLSKSSIKLTWSKVPGATKYIIYGNKCGKKSKYVKITSVKKSKTSYTRKKLAKGTYYKFMVVAVKGSDVLATSKTIHVATNGGKGKKGNPSAITLNKKSISVKVGKTYKKLKATVKAGTLKVSTHRKVAWESTDVSKAKVNSKGYITGVSKGTCYVYAYAQNGLAVKVKVKVK